MPIVSVLKCKGGVGRSVLAANPAELGEAAAVLVLSDPTVNEYAPNAGAAKEFAELADAVETLIEGGQ